MGRALTWQAAHAQLGAGTGLAGLVAARAGARLTVLTDRDDDDGRVLRSLEASVALNTWATADRVRVQALRWGDLTAAAALAPPAADVVLGADCLYHVSDFDGVLATVATLLRHPAARADAQCLLVYQERSARRTMQHQLDYWGLCARVVPWTPHAQQQHPPALSASLPAAVRDSLLLLVLSVQPR
jgi:predicted nicotinamide N-methyase